MFRSSALLLVVLFGCSADAIDYAGDPGQATLVSVSAWVPRVSAFVDSGGEQSLLVDTGAPFTALDTDSLPRLPQGRSDLGFLAFYLDFRDIPVVVFDVFDTEPTEGALAGVLGADVLRHFMLSIDYRDARAWLDEPGAVGLPVDVEASAVEETQVVDLVIAGGGLAQVPGRCADGCGTMCLAPTRLLVTVQLESLPEPVWMLVDTGASSVVLSPDTAALLGDVDRPRLDGVTVGTANGNAMAYLTRVGTMSMGAVRQTSVPVLVFDSESFALVSQEVGRPVAGLVGGSFLRRYLVTVDYRASELRLARYVDSSHIDPDEYVRVGFTMTSDSGTWLVADVYPNTDAAASGIARGDEVVQIDGTDISAMDEDAVTSLLGQFTVGQRVPVGIRAGAGLDVLSIEVEDLLPSYGGS